MSTYSNQLQPALQNLLQRVVWFFHPRSSCPSHISADICGGRKSLIKPVMWHNISSCLVLSPKIVMHDDAYIGGGSENNIICVTHDNLGWKNRTTRYILPRHWLYKWFSQFHRCGTYLVLSRSPSTVTVRALSRHGCSEYIPVLKVMDPACIKLGVGLLVVMLWLEICTSCIYSCHHYFHCP